MKNRFLFLFLIVFIVDFSAQAADNGYVALDLSTPRAAIITHLGSLQPGNCQKKIAAKVFSQTDRTEEEAIRLAVRLRDFLDERAIQINLDQIPDDPNYINPHCKFHRYQLSASLPKVYLVKVQDQWIYSEATVRFIKTYYQKYPLLCKQGILKWLPPVFKKKTVAKMYLWQLIAIVILLILLRLIHKFLPVICKQILRPFAVQDGYQEMNALAEPISLIVLALLFKVLILYMDLPLPVFNRLIIYTKSFMVIASAIMAYHFVDVGAFYIYRKTLDRKLSFNLVLLPMVKVSTKVLVIIAGVLVALHSFHFDIKGLLTGVGIGGLGFALASQDTIKNLFGSLVILMDKPFDVGDFIVSDKIDGKVEEIGFRSTRIYTAQDSTIYVPNGALANTYINNHGAKQYKKFSTVINIAYNTPLVLIQAFITGLQKIAANHPSTRADKFFVYLNDLKNSVLEIKFEVKFNVTDYKVELQSRHELLLSILKLAETLGIALTFPTQTLHMETFPEKKSHMPAYSTDQETIQKQLEDFLSNHGKAEDKVVHP